MRVIDTAGSCWAPRYFLLGAPVGKEVLAGRPGKLELAGVYGDDRAVRYHLLRLVEHPGKSVSDEPSRKLPESSSQRRRTSTGSRYPVMGTAVGTYLSTTEEILASRPTG